MGSGSAHCSYSPNFAFKLAQSPADLKTVLQQKSLSNRCFILNAGMKKCGRNLARLPGLTVSAASEGETLAIRKAKAPLCPSPLPKSPMRW